MSIKKRFIAVFLIFWIIIVIAAMITFSQKSLYRASAGVMLSDRGLVNNVFNIFHNDLLTVTAEKLAMINATSTTEDVNEVILYLRASLNTRMDAEFPVLSITSTAEDAGEALMIVNAHAEAFIDTFAEARFNADNNPYLITAELPSKKFYPHLGRNFIIGLCIAIVLSILSAGILEYLDTSLGSYSEVESFIKIPVISSIPHIERRRKTVVQHIRTIFVQRKRDVLGEQRSRLLFFQPLHSPVAESYYELLQNLQFPYTQKGNAIIFVSSENREGKSLTAANTAITAAFSGIKTLLIDADLRFSTQHHWFGLPLFPGLTDCLIGKTPIENIIHPGKDCLCTTVESKSKLLKAGLDNLFLMTSGTPGADPNALFKSHMLQPLITRLKKVFSLIVIDSSAVLHFNEVFKLAKTVEKNIFVYRSGRLSRGLLRQAVADMKHNAHNVTGLVINDVRTISSR